MKKLLRRFSRVVASSQYSPLRSPKSRPRYEKNCRSSNSVPEGNVPVYVGEEMERFVVSAELLSHPIFMDLLDKSAQEYGYAQKGALRIPCRVFVFERVLEALKIGEVLADVEYFGYN